MPGPDIVLLINIKQHGNSWYTRKTCWYLANIPLNIIDFSNWEPNRYNKKLITDTKSVKPVILGDFDETIKIYIMRW